VYYTLKRLIFGKTLHRLPAIIY